MALAFILIGAAIIVVAIRGTYGQLGSLIASDFQGGGFLYWVAALLVIAAVGYIPDMRTPSRALLALIVLAFALANGQGFFSQLSSGLASASPTPIPTTDTLSAEAPTGPFPVSFTGGSSSGSNPIGKAASGISGIAGLLGGIF